METRQWAIRVTREYWDESRRAWMPNTEDRPCRNESEALDRYDALTDLMAAYDDAKAQRISKVEVISRPVGDWTTACGMYA